MRVLAPLPSRAVIAVSGVDRVSFLQGLVSNDVTLVAPGRAVWAALLTPQGKWLADFFILADREALLLDVEAAQAAMLVQRLSRFRLRADAALALREGWAVHAAWEERPAPPTAPQLIAPAGAPVPADAVVAADPRLPDAGWRVLAPAPLAGNADATAYDRHRLALGLPDGSADCEAERSVLLEAGFDELHGISWTKGCYMGQEVTARTRYRGLLKRRLVPVAVAGALPAPGMPVLRDGIEVGTMRSGRGDAAAGMGLALLRLEAIGAPALACGEAILHPRIPAWMTLPEATS